MPDRQWLGDISLAVLLALPVVALARPQSVDHKHTVSPPAAKVAVADRLPGNGRVSLLG